MKSAAFIQMMAEALTTPSNTVTDYARRLKEAGLLSTGARGVNAPEMKPLDAARLLLAILTTSSAAQCVERVQRFGQIKYSPNFRKRYRGYQTIQPEEFAQIFKGETLEEVLASIFALPETVGIEEACKWFDKNVFHLRVTDFDVLAELYSWITEGDEIVGERVVPFKGERMVETETGFQHTEKFTPIKGGVRTERSIAGLQFLSIGLSLLPIPKESAS